MQTVDDELHKEGDTLASNRQLEAEIHTLSSGNIQLRKQLSNKKINWKIYL